MLRTKSLLLLLVLSSLGLGMNAHAAGGGGSIQRGGLGFLFPDNNSFVNPGQFVNGHATAVEALYSRQNVSGTSQDATPSIVYGNGTFGLGVYGSRDAVTLLGTPTTDTIGAGLGFGLMKGRAVVGLRYDKVLSGTNNGVASGMLTLNPAGHKGIAIGVGYNRNLSTSVSAITAGLGYSFMHNNSLEVNVTFPDINTLSNWTLGAYLTTMKMPFYLGAGYLMVRNSITTQSGVSARMGFMLGSAMDLSLTTTYFFVTGSPVTYGASFRFAM
jgi:hypothetical protein